MAAPMFSISSSIGGLTKSLCLFSRSFRWCCAHYYASKNNVTYYPGSKTHLKKEVGVSIEDIFTESKSKTYHNSRSKRFKDLLDQRYREARRSILVRTKDPQVTLQQLNSYGKLSAVHYASHEKLYLLAEFSNEQSIQHTFHDSNFFKEQNQIPMQTRCLYDFKTGVSKSSPRKAVIPIREDYLHNPSMAQYPLLESLDQELDSLCASRSLNNLDLRVRFLICSMLEDLLQSFLPGSRVIPYGSCINGFGWWNSDLDMMLCLNGNPYSTSTTSTRGNHRFRFLTEVCSSERTLNQLTLTTVAAILKMTPCISQVIKILMARVPIVRFRHSVMQLQCDISIEAMDSIKMTELLYLLSSSNPRLCPLMAGIKQWALSHKLTSSGEQQKPTTIGLLCMLIFYLQNVSPPVLPTLRDLQGLAKSQDLFYIGAVTFGFPSHPKFIPKSRNTETLESLLHGFFTFYGDFDFSTKAISMIEGEAFTKPANSSPVYIENPLNIGLNICKNVSENNIEVMKEAMRNSARKIEELSSCNDLEESRLATLLKPHVTSSDSVSISVQELFDNFKNVSEEVQGKTDLETGVSEYRS